MDNYNKSLLREFINEHWSLFVDHVSSTEENAEEYAESILKELDGE